MAVWGYAVPGYGGRREIKQIFELCADWSIAPLRKRDWASRHGVPYRRQARQRAFEALTGRREAACGKPDAVISRSLNFVRSPAVPSPFGETRNSRYKIQKKTVSSEGRRSFKHAVKPVGRNGIEQAVSPQTPFLKRAVRRPQPERPRSPKAGSDILPPPSKQSFAGGKIQTP
jgi:hypothetical protein